MAIPSSLPTGWFNYSPNQKAIWFMDNGVTPDDMRQVGVPESDINALMQFGYDAARAASVDQQNKLTSEEAARREAEMLRIIEQQKIEEQRQAEQQRLATIAAQEAARQEAARQEAARQEAARVAAAEAARQESIRVAAAQEQARAAAAAEQERLIQQQISAQQEAARQEAARQEAARVAAAEAARQESIRVAAAQEQARAAAAAEQERLIQQQISAQQEAARQEAARQEAARQAVTSSPTTYQFFGINWNPNASLAEKQGYIKTLLNQGVTADAIKAKISELDPANATQEVYDILGIPKTTAQPITTETTKQEVPIGTKLGNQLASLGLIDPSISGGAWTTQSGKNSSPGFGVQGMLSQIGQRLYNWYGITDINDLEQVIKTVPVTYPVTGYDGLYFKWMGDNPVPLTSEEVRSGLRTDENNNWYLDTFYQQPEIYNKKTGQKIAGEILDLGDWGEGPGSTFASISFGANGKPILKTVGDDSSFIGDLLPVISIALMAIPGIGQAVGAALLPTGVSTAVATAVGNAVINAGIQVASGVPVEKAIVNSAASLGVSQLVPNLTGNVYVDNAVKAVATASLTGGDVGNALANSLIATGGNDLLGNASFTGDKVVDSAIASAITSGVQAAATDGDVGASVLRGAASGASGQIAKEEKAAESAKSGAGFIGEDVTEPTNVAQPDIDPRILAQGVAGGNFGEGGLLQTGAQVPLDILQDLMKLRPELVSMNDSGNYSLKVPSSDGGFTAYEISPSGQVLNAQPGFSVGETYDPSTTASALENIIKIEEGKSSEQAVPEGSGLAGTVQPKATDLSPAAQETLLKIGGVLGLGEQDPDAVYEALIGGASGGIGDVALLGYDQLAKLQDEIEIIFDEPNLSSEAKKEIAKIYAEVADQKRIQEEAIRDQLLNEQTFSEQQVADAGLTVVGQPVNQAPVVSPTTPSVTTPSTSPVVTEPVVTQPSVTQPVVSEPVAQQPTTPDIVTTTSSVTQPAPKTELQAEIDRIMRMAVGLETADLRYDVNKDGRVNSRDAYLVNSGQAKVPTAEEYAAQQSASVPTVPNTTPQVTQPVDQAPATTAPSTGPATSTGVVLQNNGDGTALVLTNDGSATNVPATDAVSNEPLTPGSSVTINQNTNTATVTPPASDGGAQEPIVPSPPTVQNTGSQQVIGGGQQPTTDAGSIIDTPIGPDTSASTVPEPIVEEPVVQEPPPPPPPPPDVPTTPEELITESPQEPVVDKTEEDILLEQIIRELEPTPPEDLPVAGTELPEEPTVSPETPVTNINDRLTIRPVVDRGFNRPSVSPGSRVEESAQILPLRPGLSEGGTGGIEGTTEQEQEPVWNVRSLKLRRLLGI